MNIHSDGPHSFKMRDNVIHRLMELSATFTKTATLAYRREFDIGRPEALIINMVGHHGGLKAADIASHSSFDKALVARAVRKLIVKKLLKSEVDASDRRRHNLTLTKRGQNIFEQNVRSARLRYETWINGLSYKELSNLEALLKKLGDNAEKEHVREAEWSKKNSSAILKCEPGRCAHALK